MVRPLLRAEAIISNDTQSSFLVQCDEEESFYRLPGGSIEFRETAADAILRELIEEFDLTIEVGDLVCVNENIIEYDGLLRHNCTLIHWCSLNPAVTKTYKHKEHPEIKLVWRTLEELKEKSFYPEGILSVLSNSEKELGHIVINKKYR